MFNRGSWSKRRNKWSCSNRREEALTISDFTLSASQFEPRHLGWNEGDKPTGAEQLNQSLDKVGLELVPARRSIEMLMVEKTN